MIEEAPFGSPYFVYIGSVCDIVYLNQDKDILKIFGEGFTANDATNSCLQLI